MRNGHHPSMPPAPPYEAVGTQPPTAPDAEAAVLGSLLLDPSHLPRVRAILPDAAALYDVRHRNVYEAILALADAGQPVDLVGVNGWLAERDKTGAGYYLSELPTRVGHAENAEFYAMVAREAAIKRDLIRRLTGTLGRAYQPGSDAFGLLDEVRAVFDEATKGLPGRALTPARDAFGSASEAVLREAREGIAPGVKTGFAALDGMLGSLRPGNLYCFAGRPAMGKSMLAASLARRIAGRGTAVAYFSLEMRTAENAERMLAAEADVDGARLQARQLMDPEQERIAGAATRLAGLPIHFDDTPGLTPEDLRAKLHRLTVEGPVPVVVVDYLQLMRGKGENRTQEVGYCSRSLKGIAMEYGCAVVALSQLSRGVEARKDKRPQLSDLRDSGEIEQDCDLVAFLYRPEYYQITHEERPGMNGPQTVDLRGMCEVIVAKQRNGDTGSAWLAFDGSRTRFLDRHQYTGEPLPSGSEEPAF
ncbi:MAG TPA: replicative DNA helicase [Rubricoccaceae bacterium]|nr:replicative DNA helicase [Rubricoccaceae bacterium]